MIITRMTKRIISVLLIISLMCANLNLAILGFVSYARDNVQDETEEKMEKENKKELEIQISDFCKNNMLEQETEYSETLTLNLKHIESLKKVEVADLKSSVNDGTTAEDTEKKEIQTIYKTTKINQKELLEAIGIDGILKIEYQSLEQENENTLEDESEVIFENIVVLPEIQGRKETIVLPEVEEKNTTIVLPEIEEKNEIIVLPEVEEEVVATIPEESEDEKGIIEAENEVIEISKQTETDEAGYITIVYPKHTISMKITIIAEVNNIENLEIVNNKIIGQVTELEGIKLLETSKNITAYGEEEILNLDEIIETPIYYTKTVAELGIDKKQISTSVENKVNFTVTMATDKNTYDLYKNPYFIIELPNEIKSINIDNVILLNNKYFEVESIEQGILENGNSAVAIKLLGEQTESTKSMEENMQIVIETTMTTNELIPTLERSINLHYQNEAAKTYDGIGEQINGISMVPVNLISNSEIIVETKAIIGENEVVSFKEEVNTAILEPNTYQSAKIIGTAINNTGNNIQNAKIIGTATTVGPILGAEQVYYTQNIDATQDIENAENAWSAEYVQGAKKFLILISEFNQGQIITFNYDTSFPQDIEEDITHEVKFDVYDNNDSLMKTSKVIIEQEAPRFDVFEDEKIKASIQFENTNKIEIGERVRGTINISNISGEPLENVELELLIPEEFQNVEINAEINGRYIKLNKTSEENITKICGINIANNENITIILDMITENYIKQTAKVESKINYMGRQINISNKLSVVEPSLIETTITSNKLGKQLDENETIEYKVTLKNIGESHAETDLILPVAEELRIYSIQTVNMMTSETEYMAGSDLTRKIEGIEINPQEVVEVSVKCIVKSLEENSKITMYAQIDGENVEKIDTGRLTNTINRKEIEEEKEAPNKLEAQGNIIKGSAWIDQNENGKKDNNEILLKGVQALLIDTESAEIVDTTTTNNSGEYEFKNINEGNYLVQFKYNENTFRITNYKDLEATEDLDSDVISTTHNNQNVAKTEVIELRNGTVENANIGLIVNKKFDMSINKGITKVTVDNEKEIKTYDFNSNNMAKVEIDGEYLKGSLIMVEYEIAITNVGEVAGYAKSISDKIPAGMKFNSELNPSWYEGEEGELHCVALSDKEILPGETVVVKLVLTKEMTDDKIVSPINTVKIEETFNEYLIQDRDLENNTSEATIIISLTTGKVESYAWLILLVITIIGTGIFGVIKITNRTDIKFTKNGKE